MTNEERIKSMNTEELTGFLRGFSRNICRHPEYADIPAWLKSDDVKMIYKGEDTTYSGRPAKLVDTTSIYGRPYNVIICENEIIRTPGENNPE